MIHSQLAWMGERQHGPPVQWPMRAHVRVGQGRRAQRHRSGRCQLARPGADRCMLLRVHGGQVERPRPLTIAATLRHHSAEATAVEAAATARGIAAGGKAVRSWVLDGCRKGPRTMGATLWR